MRGSSKLFFGMCKDLKVLGNIYAPNNSLTKEMINYGCVLNDSTDRIINVFGRNINVNYLKKELLWYLSKENNILSIYNEAQMWKKVCDIDGGSNSNYGHYVFDRTQFNWVIHSLMQDKESRQAVINFNQPYHKYIGNKDFVCTINTQYLIRDNSLIAITNMRSNDLIFGFCNDLPFFTLIQEIFYFILKKSYKELKLGRYYHNIASLHVYERHFNMLDNILNSYQELDEIKMPSVNDSFIDDIKFKTNKSELMQWLNN